jgi:dihydrofolate reductase
MIRLIAAIDSKRGLATDTGIPWDLPGDGAYFAEQTRTGQIVMGRGTYAEFDAPLHDRTNLVLTTSQNVLRPGFQPVASLREAVDASHGTDVWIIGGAMVYSQAIALADVLLLTQVRGDFGCTKFFPRYDEDFTLAEHSEDQQENSVSYRFETWLPAAARSG